MTSVEWIIVIAIVVLFIWHGVLFVVLQQIKSLLKQLQDKNSRP
jgi:hypothetical protein